MTEWTPERMAEFRRYREWGVSNRVIGQLMGINPKSMPKIMGTVFPDLPRRHRFNPATWGRDPLRPAPKPRVERKPQNLWKPEEIELLEEFLAERDCPSYAELGKFFGRTKNAIAGLVNRLGLSDSDEPIRAPIEFPPPGHCVFPHGHPGEVGFGFCGVKVERRGRPYCNEHHARCWYSVDLRIVKSMGAA